jgi:hypothetical protein
MLAIILAALGASLAATGFMFIGIAHSIQGGNDALWNSGWVLMVGGAIATVIGGLLYRSAESKLAVQRISTK